MISFIYEIIKKIDMKKIKEGNDFVLNWTIMQEAGTPIETEGIYEEKLFLRYAGRKVEVSFQRTENIIHVEVTPPMTPVMGAYALEWVYKKPDPTFSRGYKNRVLGMFVFQIVPAIDKDDDLRVIEVTSILRNTD